MAFRLATLLPRAVIVAVVWVLGTAAFTLAADNTIVGSAKPNASATPAAQPELIVHVAGSVHGYSSNRVVTQSPAAGTRVVDTGAPTVTLRLVRGPYEQLGQPADNSPYSGTAIRLAGLASVTKPAAKPKTAPKAKPAAKPKAKPTATPAKPKAASKPKLTARPPAFTVKGAPKEPLDEMPLTARAERLEAWVASKPKTSANVRHWLYQHAWIVTGAKFGWWHGAEALQTLIRVDQHVEREWGIGAKSEAVAQAALAQVRRRSQ
jgi:cell division protein FtsN